MLVTGVAARCTPGSVPHDRAALTIATMPALIASGSPGQAATTAAKSGSFLRASFGKCSAEVRVGRRNRSPGSGLASASSRRSNPKVVGSNDTGRPSDSGRIAPTTGGKTRPVAHVVNYRSLVRGFRHCDHIQFQPARSVPSVRQMFGKVFSYGLTVRPRGACRIGAGCGASIPLVECLVEFSGRFASNLLGVAPSAGRWSVPPAWRRSGREQ